MLHSRNFIKAAAMRNVVAHSTRSQRVALALHSEVRRIHVLGSYRHMTMSSRLVLQQNQMIMARQFSSARAGGQAIFENGKNMTAEDAQRLNYIQSAYINDNMNARKAYEYFHELNKHQYYMTVVKEYEELQERIKNSRGFGSS